MISVVGYIFSLRNTEQSFMPQKYKTQRQSHLDLMVGVVEMLVPAVLHFGRE